MTTPTAEKIGTLILKEPTEFVEHYEVARWYTKGLVPAGSYSVTGTFKDGHLEHYGAQLPGVVTGSDQTSLFGGVPCGKPKIDELVGQPFTFRLNGSYAGYCLAKDVLEGTSQIVLEPGLEAVYHDFVYDGKPCRTTRIVRKAAQEVR